MATGAILTSIEFPPSLRERPLTSTPALLPAADVTSGPLTSHQPIAIRSLALTGTAMTSFTEDWYNRLHLNPKLIDYGAVGAETPRPVTLWNAYLGNTTLSDMDISSPEGITLSGPSVPRTLRPLEYVTHNVIAKLDGPSEIDSQVLYSTSRPDSLVVELTGQRANLWPFFPNWRESVSVESSFKTDILTSRSGREQRRALRGVPRKVISYTTTVHGNRLRAFNRAMAKWQNRPVVMGDPTRSVRVSIASGGYTTTYFPTPEWIYPGASVVLDNAQLLTVDTVSPLGEVTFTQPTDIAGTTLRPALTGQLGQSLSGSQQTSATMEVSITFDVTPGSEQPNVGSPGVDLLNGREVFARKFNWANGQDVQYDWSVDTLDFGFGRTSVTRPIAFDTVTRKATFVQQGADDMEALEQFFQRQKGQRGEFYMPTGTDDLPLMQGVAAGGNILKISGRDTFDAYSEDTVHSAVALYFRDGRRLYRGVSSMYLDGSDTVLVLDRSFLVGFAPSDLFRVSWLTVSRFASDQFTQEWLTDGVAQSQLAVSTLEALPVEDPIADYDGAAQWVLENWGPEAGMRVFDAFDYLVNIAYPAVWFIPEAWTSWNSTQQGLSGLDHVVNYRFAEIFSE